MVNGAFEPSPETPERAQIFLAALNDLGLAPEAPPDSGQGALAAVHDTRYLTFLETILPRWQRIAGAPEEVVPNLHPVARSGEAPAGYPASAVGQVGYHIMDGAAPINAETWRSAYALCRPPGHHAAADLAGGFCFLNNAAIAAERLRSRCAKVAVLDVDVHHGNGTQQIFYQRDDVLTVSLHADPVRFYPFFWGYADERGSAAGKGCNLNVPLPRGTGDEGYLAALDRALERIVDFAPGALVVALGLDAHESDPVQGLAVTTRGFRRIAARIAALGLPSVLVQEGGYANAALAANLRAVIEAFLLCSSGCPRS